MLASRRLCTEQDIASVHKLTKTYLSLLQTVLPLAVWGLVLALGVSFGIPKFLCKDAWKMNKAGAYILDDMEKCVYLHSADGVFKVTKIPGLVFWSFMEAGHILLPGVIAYVLLDYQRQLRELHGCILIGAAMSSVLLTVVFPTFFKISLNKLIVASSLSAVALIASICSGQHVARLCNEDFTVLPSWAITWTGTFFMAHLYPLILKRIVTFSASGVTTAVMLFGLHPAVFGVFECLHRHLARKIGVVKNCHHIVPLLYLHLLRSIYGWFLLFQMGSRIGSIYALIGIVSSKKILDKIVSRNKDAWILKQFYTRKATEALLAQQEENHLVLADAIAHIISEHIGLLVVAAFISFANTDDVVGSKNVQQAVWYLCILAQIASSAEGYITFAVDFRLHQIDVESYWKPKSTLHIITLLFPIVTLCGLDTLVRTVGILCSKGEGEADTSFEFCPMIGMF